METSGAGQGGSSTGGIFDQVMKYVEMALNPLKLIEGIIGACTGGGGDQVSQSTQTAPQETDTTATEMWESVQSQGYAKGRPKKADEDLIKALDIVDQNFDLFDTANGKSKKDGKVTLHELTMIANDSALPKELRDAAKAIMLDRELMARLDRAGGGTATDGAFTRLDVQTVKAKIEKSIMPDLPEQIRPTVEARTETAVQQGDAQHAPEAAPTPALPTAQEPNASNGSLQQSQSSLSSVIDDPSISFEDKTTTVLDGMMAQAEAEQLDAYSEMDAAIEKQRAAVTDKDQRDAEALTRQVSMKLQRMMQQRQEMFTLLSNMTSMFHEMAMTAIHNMKG